MIEIGDRIVVESEKVGDPPRTGVVTGVGNMLRVRWDTGSETSFVPSAGSLQVVGHEDIPIDRT